GWHLLSGSPLATWAHRDAGEATVSFVKDRFHAWIHLLAIPGIYLCVDYVVRNRVLVAKKSLPLDLQVLAVGLACAAAGAVEGGHGLFEAGSSAAILLLGNWMYLSYLSNLRQPSAPVRLAEEAGAG